MHRGLMWAGTEPVLGHVAVVAEDLEARREAAAFQPFWESASGRPRSGASMSGSVVVDVVNGKECSLALATAGALAPVGGNHLITNGVSPLLHTWSAPREPVSLRPLVEGVIREDTIAGETAPQTGVFGQLPVASAWASAITTHPVSLVDGLAVQTPRRASAKLCCLFFQAAVWAAPHSTSIAQAEL